MIAIPSPDDCKPLHVGLVTVHHRTSGHRGLFAAGNALVGICSALQQMAALPTATRADEAVRPPPVIQELGASRLVGEPLLEFQKRRKIGHRPRSCLVGGAESSRTWDNGISL